MARKKSSADNHKKFVPNVRLRKAREQRNLKQNELAEEIGVTPVTVSRWENGKSIPTPYYRQKLCEFFQMDDDALGFIPTGESEAAFTQNTPPATWNVPYHQNPFFTGREDIFARLQKTLMSKRKTALIQPLAMSGLGGVGKTQIALEYAYRYRHEYHTIVWVRADSSEALTSDFAAIATLLNLPEKDAPEQSRAVEAVQRWLAFTTGWLLILDNADDLHLASEFIPSPCPGHVLLTTQSHIIGKIAYAIEIDMMTPEEGTLLLLRRARLLAMDASLDQVPATSLSLATDICQLLDGLPLAINQAGAFIEETGCGLSNYLQLYQTHQEELLQWMEEFATDYPYSVATTWSLSFAKIGQANPAAADLLQLCAFLAPDAIPEEILTQGSSELGPALQSVAADPFQLDMAIKELLKYSLLRRNPDTQTLTIHRLVQAVLKDRMGEGTRRHWAKHAVRVVNRLFPDVQFSTWELCQRYLPQTQVCADLIIQYQLAFPEAARLLDRTGHYLYKRGRYTEADPLLHHALAISEKVLGPEHPDTTTSLNDLASLYQAQGKYKQAEPLFQRALAIREQILGPQHPQTATSLNGLAMLYQAQGRYKQAALLCQRALAIREKMLGPQHPDTATSLNTLADLYARLGRHEEAKQLCLRSRGILERTFGAAHPEMARSYSILANIYIYEGRYQEAEQLCHQALAIREQFLGLEHPEVARSLESFATLLRMMGRKGEALKLKARARAIRFKQAQETSLFSPGRDNTDYQGVDPLKDFLASCCVLHPAALSSASDLWLAYQDWLKVSGERFPIRTQKAFAGHLKSIGCRPYRTNKSRMWRGVAIIARQKERVTHGDTEN